MSYDLDKITYLLAESKKFCGDDFHFLEKVNSTNAWLLDQNRVDGKICLTENQIAGKGRVGKSWIGSEGGSILLSMGWQLDSISVEGLSLVSGLAVAKSLSDIGVSAVTLKWPNDIILANKKVGGILIEIASSNCVVGIGLNIKLPKSLAGKIDQPWADLESQGYSVDRDALVANMVLNHEKMFAKYTAHGFSCFQEEWNLLHEHQNQIVNVHTGDIMFSGEAQGVDDHGALIVQTKGEIRKIWSGEVSIRSRSG